MRPSPSAGRAGATTDTADAVDQRVGVAAAIGAAIIYGAAYGERLPPLGVVGAALILAAMAVASGLLSWRRTA